MTEEEIKNLKKGDTFTLKFTVAAVCQAGVYVDLADFHFDSMTEEVLRHATLAQPAPTFEVGDTVRIIPDPLTDTIYNKGYEFDLCYHGKAVKIAGSVDARGEVAIASETGLDTLSIHCLELVKKAVKDRYKVEKVDINFCVKDGKCAVAHFSINSHPNAEAAAKAECDRLNAEWRKQNESA